MPRQTKRARRVRDESGVTLVELLVSMAILAIVLTAFAGTIVVALRSITGTEHEVTATQFVAEVSESVQIGDFDFVGLYADEVDPGIDPDATTWAGRLDGATTFEGNELVLFAGPDGGRDDRVPEPFVSDTRGGIDVRVDRYLTWVDRDGDGVVETKRLTSFASWLAADGSPRELRFESERVPTQEEAIADVNGRRVIDFRFAPNPVELDDVEGRTSAPVAVSVRTNVAVSSGALSVYEYVSVTDTWSLRTVPMSAGEPAGLGWVTWTATVPGSSSLANGQVDFLFTGVESNPDDPADATFTGLGTLDTFGGPWDFDTPTPGIDSADGDSPTTDPSPDPDPTVDPGPAASITVETKPLNLCVDNSTWRTTEDLTIVVATTGLDADDGAVTVSYPYYTSQPLRPNGSPNKNQSPTATALDSLALQSGNQGNARWGLTIPASSRIFNPQKFQSVTFDLVAERNGGAFPQDTATTSFVLTATSGC